MTVTASNLVPFDGTPTIDGLWAPSVLFLPDWKTPIAESISYLTTVEKSRLDAEQRFGRTDKPQRSLRYTLRSYSSAAAQQIRAQMLRMGTARFPCPLWPDKTRLTGKPDPDFTAYSGDFLDRRFQPGGWAAIVKEGGSETGRYVLRKILSVTSTLLTLDGDLEETYGPPSVGFKYASTSSTGGTMLGSTVFALAKGQSVFLTLVSKSTLANAVSSVRIRNIHTQKTLTVTSLKVVDVSKSITGTRFNLAVVAGLPDQTSEVFGACVVEWFVSGGTHSDINHSTEILDGTHQVETVQTFLSDDTAGGPTVNAIDFNPGRVNSKVMVLHAVSASSGSFAIYSPGTMLVESTTTSVRVGIQQYDAPIVALSTYSATFNVSSPAEGFIACAVSFNPIESNGLDRSWAYPVIESELSLDSQGKAINDSIVESSIFAMERPGVSALDPQQVPGTVPGWCPTHNSVPIMTLPIDWQDVEVGTFRIGEQTKAGIGYVLQAFGSKPGSSFTLPFLPLSRQEAMRLLAFFDSRGGRLHPFWLACPVGLTSPVSIVGSTVVLAQDLQSVDWSSFSNIAAYRKSTGTTSIHSISSVASGSGTITLTVSPAMPSTTITDYDISIAHLLRFDSDEIELLWTTDDKCRVAMECVELLDERSISIELLDYSGPGGLCGPWAPNNNYDLCHALRCGTSSLSGCCVCGLEKVIVTATCYDGDCLPTIGCGDGCQKTSTCTMVLSYVSCVGNIARWENGSNWAELDTLTGLWTFDVSAFLLSGSCCADVNQGGICLCFATGACVGQPLFTEEHSCCAYVKKVQCNPNSNDGYCNYVEVLRIEQQYCKNDHSKC